MSTTTTSARAIVTRGAHRDGKWNMEDILLRPIKDDELLVQMVASGICHTDVLFGDAAENIGGYPRIMGHEGSGYVKEFGKDVKVAQVGDPVLLSFPYCSACQICTSGHPSHCVSAMELCFVGNKTCSPAASSNPSAATAEISASFFGQSSFASLSIVNESSVVNAKDLIKSKDEMKIFAPLGCGFQTGSGSIYNVANCSPSDTVAIMGVGGVGLSGVMGAKIGGARTIIAIDRVPARLELAKEIGATHTINSDGMDMPALIKAVRHLTDGYGSSITMDTTGLPKLIAAGVEFTRRKGQYVQIGSASMDAKIEIEIFNFMASGKKFIGAVEGDIVPTEYIPKMIGWYREGKFPIDKLMKTFKADDFMGAIHEMHTGETIKPIIVW
ncbi:putative alcohol dehydrogenase protein [Venturia nashicola]|nr:putative alcohol dehydrogenase protein [Venturia nashicola]